MNNLKLFLPAILCMSVLFVGCGDDKDVPGIPDINATVRYEASVSDSVNYKIRVLYMEEDDGDGSRDHAKEVIVESPWSYEMKNRKTGAVLYVSTLAVPRNDAVTPDTEVRSAVYIDGKLHEEDSGAVYALVMYVLGAP